MNDDLIKTIADMLTDDPDVFKETKKATKKSRKGKVDEFECEDGFDVEGNGHENQKEPRKPGVQTHKTTLND